MENPTLKTVHLVAVKSGMVLTLMVCWLGVQTGIAQTDEFPIGFFLFGGVSVDFQQMRNELGVNWVQGSGGAGTIHNNLERNVAGINVVSIRPLFWKLSKAQRLVYEAESPWPPQPSTQTMTYAFFGQRPAGSTKEGARVCQYGVDSPGYMARQPRPDNRLSADTMQYFATYRLKTVPTSDAPEPVATLCVLCYKHQDTLAVRKLSQADFPSPDTYYDFEVPFHLVSSSGVAGKKIVCDSIDVQVYWHGQVTTWLDKVTIDDMAAKQLFSGAFDGEIETEVRDYASMSDLNPVQRFYLTDEPDAPGFLPFNYLDRKISSLLGGERGWAVASVYWDGSMIRWLIRDGKPHEVWVHHYVIRATVPSPSIDATMASSLGIAQYVDNNQYNNLLQPQFDMFERQLSDAARYSKEGGVPFWSVVQLHGEYIVKTGKYVYPGVSQRPGLRPPTGPEISAQIGIAIAFGAKGIIGYPFGTDGITSFAGSRAYMTGLISRRADPDGIYRDHSSNTALLPVGNADSTKMVYTGCSEKWDAFKAIGERLGKLGKTLMGLDWKGTKSWYHQPGATYAPLISEWKGVVRDVSTKNTGGRQDDDPAVVVGHFTDVAGTDYLWVLNRRCDYTNNVDVRDIQLDLGFPRDAIVVTNLEGDGEWRIKGDGSFTDRFGAGEGRLYRVK